METVEDLDSTALCCNQPPHKNKLYDRSESLVVPYSPPLQSSLAGLSQYPYLSCINTKPTTYVDIFIDNFFIYYRVPLIGGAMSSIPCYIHWKMWSDRKTPHTPLIERKYFP